MIRLLTFVLVFYVAYRLLGLLLRLLLPPARHPAPEKTAAGEEMVRDPQCGTFVPRGDAVSRTVGGTTHHFCSPQCRDKYLAQAK